MGDRIAMMNDWLSCKVTIKWMPVAKHLPLSDMTGFVAMHDGQIRPARYSKKHNIFTDDGGYVEPEYWCHGIMSPQDYLEDEKMQREFSKPSAGSQGGGV